jgi:hypothetical protein
MRARVLLAALLLAPALPLAFGTASAQLTIVESGFLGTTLSQDLTKQVEIGFGADTCLYYGSFEGLRRRCSPADTGEVCDPALTFPVGIAFSAGGSFGAAMYVADYGINDIHRLTGCGASTPFATLLGPGSLAFPPAGSPYGDWLYACVAFDGPIVRVSAAGAVSDWLELDTAYLRFGPGGAWGTGLYATDMTMDGGGAGIVRVSSAGVVTPLFDGFFVPEGFDWAFGGDLFATDPILGEVRRILPDGSSTLFATLPGAADIAWRAGEQALYVVSNQGGLYRIVAGDPTSVPVSPAAEVSLAVSPNPSRAAVSLRFTMGEAGLARAQVLDAQGRLVRRLSDAWRPAGVHAIAWDGRDEAGSPVRPGTYFARVVTDGVARGARVTIVR